AARGGYTGVCAMPNLNPAPDCIETLAESLSVIERDAQIEVIPYGTITRGEKGERLSDMAALSPYVCGFTDDGRGVQSEELMREAMRAAKAAGKPIVAHCEDNSLLKKGGCVHDGEYARLHSLIGISSESEWKQLERDLRLVSETGCRYHVCHISTKESVALIRSAKAAGLPVTCETAPHYLALCDEDLRDEGRFKMNPPIRSRADRAALLEGLADGTIDMIATDHAPHSKEEKAGGLQKSIMGITGLETAFPVLYTRLIKTGALPLETLVERLSVAPRRFLGRDAEIKVGARAEFAALDLDKQYTIDSGSFLSLGRSTPFDGDTVTGEVAATIYRGRVIWDRNTQRSL
ncbi:MAG: dihydroorotase, partial [Ruminococcaceae bacterium]|nr:dihydroorotase [Oscillospiraceae bacterium]